MPVSTFLRHQYKKVMKPESSEEALIEPHFLTRNITSELAKTARFLKDAIEKN